MKIKRCIIIVLAAATLVCAIVVYSNPLRKSEERIRQDMLELTPAGTTMTEAIKAINENKWKIDWIDDEHGFGMGLAHIPGEEYDTEVGEKSIRIYMGEYRHRFFFPADVVVYYGFDGNEKLVDIAVRKDIDTL